MLLARENRASRPPKPCHHQSQRHTRSVMPLAKKQQAPRQPERKHAKQGGWASTTLPHAATYRPNPLACKRAARPVYRPCCLKANRYADKKPSPVGRAEDMPVCLFAQGPFASAEYLVQLTSSLAQKVCLARGSPCPPGEWLKSHIAQPAEKGASS